MTDGPLINDNDVQVIIELLDRLAGAAERIADAVEEAVYEDGDDDDDDDVDPLHIVLPGKG